MNSPQGVLVAGAVLAEGWPRRLEAPAAPRAGMLQQWSASVVAQRGLAGRSLHRLFVAVAALAHHRRQVELVFLPLKLALLFFADVAVQLVQDRVSFTLRIGAVSAYVEEHEAGRSRVRRFANPDSIKRYCGPSSARKCLPFALLRR